MEAIKFEKDLENKENYISQRLGMGIPLKESNISKVDEGEKAIYTEWPDSRLLCSLNA